MKYVFVEYTSLVSEINRVSPFVANPHQTPPLKKTNLEFTQFKKNAEIILVMHMVLKTHQRKGVEVLIYQL